MVVVTVGVDLADEDVVDDRHRGTDLLALTTFAVLNALAWVAGLRVVAGVLHSTVPTAVLGTVAVVTGLAALVSVGALRRLPAPAPR